MLGSDLAASPAAGISGHLIPSLDLFGLPIAEPRPVGAPRHATSPELRVRIRQLRAQRNPRLKVDEIAVLVGLNRNTLYRHYAAELGSKSQAWRRLDQREGDKRWPKT